jgi:hypothetical protein
MPLGTGRALPPRSEDIVMKPERLTFRILNTSCAVVLPPPPEDDEAVVEPTTQRGVTRPANDGAETAETPMYNSKSGVFPKKAE